jgi:hypothetical protein
MFFPGVNDMLSGPVDAAAARKAEVFANNLKRQGIFGRRRF